MVTIDEIIDRRWEFSERTGVKPQSVAMGLATYRNVMRLKDGNGAYFMGRLDGGDHTLLGLPVVLDDGAVGVEFRFEVAGKWICDYCGATLENGNAQCTQCGGWK